MNRTAACAFVLSISLASLGAPANAAEPVEEAIADWVAQIDAAPDWSARFASLDYDSADDTATVTGLTVELLTVGTKFSFEPISIRGYREKEDGTFAAESIASDGFGVTGNGDSTNVSEIRLAGIGNISRQFRDGIEWDDQRPFTSLMRAYARFVDIRLTHGEIGSVSIVAQSEDGNVAASYEDIAIDGWGNGKVASFSSGPLTIAGKTRNGRGTITVGSISGRDLDYASTLRIYDPDEYVGGVGDGIWRTAAAFIGYDDIAIDAEGTTLTLKSASVEDFRVRQPERSFNEVFDRAMRDPPTDAEPTPEELRAIFDYFSAFAVGSVAVREFNGSAEDTGRLRIGGITVRDFSSEGIEEFSIDDAEAGDSSGFANVGRFAFGGVVFPRLEALLEAAEAQEAGAPFDYTELATKLAFVEALAVDADPPDSPRFKLDKARLDLGNYVGPVPTLLALEIAGADLPLAAIEDPRLRSTLQTLGYDRARGDFTAKLAWNEADQSVAIDDVRFALAGVGTVSLDALLVGLPREALDNVDSLPDALIGMSFVEGGLALENYAVLDRWIDQQSAATGVEESQLRQQVAILLTHLTTDIGNAGFRDQLQRAIVSAVTTPGPITVTATPVAPVPLAALSVLARSAPANLPELLGVTIEQSASGAPGGR